MSKTENYAGFWLRFLAWLIDAAILGVLGSGISVLMFLMNTSESFTSLFIVGLTWLYYAFMESSNYQGTVGKLALGIQVTDLRGEQITFANATGRHFAKYLSGIILLLGFIMIGFTKQKQGLHDMMARCLVVRKY